MAKASEVQTSFGTKARSRFVRLPIFWSCLIGATLSIAACTNRARPLVFATGTIIGVEATTAEGMEQRFIVGFKRYEGALVPTVYEDKTKNPKTPAPSNPTGASTEHEKIRSKAYSVFAALDFESKFLERTTIVQVFGTGKAAKILAGSPTGLANMTRAAKNLRPLDGELASAAISTISFIYDNLLELADPIAEGREEDPVAQRHVDALDGFAVTLAPTLQPFTKYIWNGPTKTLSTKARAVPQFVAGGNEQFLRLAAYLGDLESSVWNLGQMNTFAAKNGTNLRGLSFQIEVSGAAAREVVTADIDALLNDVSVQKPLLGDLERKVSTSPAAKQALQYYIERITK